MTEKSQLHIYTGDGKGKTTASLGLALRTLGAGMKVYYAQFMKDGSSAEFKLMKDVPNIILRFYGRGGFISGVPSPEDVSEAGRGLKESAQAMASGEFGLVVLDEANMAVSKGLFSADELLRAVDGRANSTEVVLTGRNAPRKLLDAAGLVTEMKKIRHYADSGVKARYGIEK